MRDNRGSGYHYREKEIPTTASYHIFLKIKNFTWIKGLM